LSIELQDRELSSAAPASIPVRSRLLENSVPCNRQLLYLSKISLGAGEMRSACFAILAASIFVASTGASHGQQLGEIKNFGDDGRLFSSGNIDYYLLSIQSYMSEDSTGYLGSVRAVKKYPGGGYEIKLKDYSARCVAPFDHLVQIAWFEPGIQNSISVPIKNPDKRPKPDNIESYNLYWAVCRQQFRRFK
jgi:hypothetical protein